MVWINVVRVWQQPVEVLLTAGLPILPLAPVSDVEVEKLPGVLVTISQRLVSEATPDLAALLWAATKVLMGLRYSEEKADELIHGVSAMILGIRGIEESTVYQGIFAKGRAEGVAAGAAQEARKNLLLLGGQKLGQPDERVLTQIADLTDLDRLDFLLGRILNVESWGELLAPLQSSQSLDVAQHRLP